MKLKDIVDKLTSYNLFNYLFPGFVFVIIMKKTTSFIGNLEYDLTGVVLIYFVGLILSRIGSLIIETVLLRLKKIDKINTKLLFEKFKDNLKLEIIHEAMNMYRTLASTSLILSLLKITDMIKLGSYTLLNITSILLEIAVFVLFTFAFTKQRQKVLECL